MGMSLNAFVRDGSKNMSNFHCRIAMQNMLSTAIVKRFVQTSGLKSVSVPSHSNDAYHDDDEGHGRRHDGGRLQDLAFAAAFIVVATVGKV